MLVFDCDQQEINIGTVFQETRFYFCEKEYHSFLVCSTIELSRMDLDSWEDSDLEFRSSTPIFTSDDEQYPLPIVSPSYAPVLVPVRNAQTRFSVVGYPVTTSSMKFGQRKQRRFENDLLFSSSNVFSAIPRDWGRAGLNPTMAALCAQLEAIDLAEQVQVYESVFSQLKKCDAALLDAFFDGEAVFVNLAPPSSTSKRALNDARPENKSSISEETVEDAIRRVDKKARKHLVRATDFVRGLEAVLLSKCMVLDCGEVERCNDGGQKETVFVALESPFLRMMAHGVAQFYEIPSRTTRNVNGQSQVRFHLIKPVKTSLRLSKYLDIQTAKRGA